MNATDKVVHVELTLAEVNLLSLAIHTITASGDSWFFTNHQRLMRLSKVGARLDDVYITEMESHLQ